LIYRTCLYWCIFVEKKWSSCNVRQRFHRTGSNRNRDIPGSDRPLVSPGLFGTVPFGTANRFQLGLLSSINSKWNRFRGNVRHKWNCPVEMLPNSELEALLSHKFSSVAQELCAKIVFHSHGVYN